MRNLNQFAHVSGRSSPQAAQGERRSNQDGPAADQFRRRNDLVNGIARHRLTDGQVDRFTHLVEQFPVLRFVNGVQIRADQFHPKSLQGAVVRKFAGDVECGLAPHPGEQRTRAFLFEDLCDGVGQQRFDVNDVRHFGVVLNGGRVGIDENDLVAVFTQRSHGLRA